MNVHILKFGGSSFRQPGDYIAVARHLADRREAGESKIVVVVSAMAGMTDRLKNTLRDVDRNPLPSSLDAALATGEMFSACMLETAVSRLGISVISLNGYTLGIKTNSDFRRASIDCVNPKPILTALKEHDVVIAAGGQGIDQSGKLTFLGRNSSDLSAVAIASTLGENTCEIYSDVRGVYTADPNLVPEAQLIPKIAYRRIAEMSRYGAKVLHHGAVDYAEKNEVTINCKSLTGGEAVAGTIVTACGHNTSSVIVARDASILPVASAKKRDSLREVLHQHNISAICLEDDHSPCLCIITDIDYAMHVLALEGTPTAPVRTRTVVTDFDDPVIGIYWYADYEQAVGMARDIHRRIYPDAMGEASVIADKAPEYLSLFGNSARRIDQ
ncbi:uridylate kinase (plasmid) [Rhizobium sullae]|uniref:aspartate kinase n=1 Tax=Rhizobium sullae TaxID=50338 RepID=A0ABY5XZB5_RHISU|nr:uridylate kinase [Rhizobium sullae]UWU19464.1 uridylate kinase [Rhizobium sullae]